MATLPILPLPEGTAAVEVDGQQMDILGALIRYTAAFDQSGNQPVSMPWQTNVIEQPVGNLLALSMVVWTCSRSPAKCRK
jgi:hypothetical protein